MTFFREKRKGRGFRGFPFFQKSLEENSMFFTLFFFSIKCFQNFRKKPFRVEKRQEISFFLILLFYKDLYIFFRAKRNNFKLDTGELSPIFWEKIEEKQLFFLNNILGFPKNAELVGKKPHWKMLFFITWKVNKMFLISFWTKCVIMWSLSQ